MSRQKTPKTWRLSQDPVVVELEIGGVWQEAKTFGTKDQMAILAEQARVALSQTSERYVELNTGVRISYREP